MTSSQPNAGTLALTVARVAQWLPSEHFGCHHLKANPALAFMRDTGGVLQQRGYKIVSGGTDNHLMLIDLSVKPYTGKDADAALSDAYITANKNSVPNDPRSPFVTSGLCIGTPAVTTRGFDVAECEQLAGWLCDVLDAQEAGGNAPTMARDLVREQVVDMCRRHPAYR